MPKIKQKTNRGAAKRFKVTASGKVLRRRSFLRHILTSKPKKRKRKLRKATLVSVQDSHRIQALLPYGSS